MGAGGGDGPLGVTLPGEISAGEAPSGEVTPSEACCGRNNFTVPAGVLTPKSRAEV